jgi:hypothetical protein
MSWCISNHRVIGSKMEFYPTEIEPSAGLSTETFCLEPLKSSHVNLDYDAVITSRDLLNKWSHSSWPGATFTVEENLEDLERHEKEHLERVAFTYTILNPDKKECLGCVYINPLSELLDEPENIKDKYSVSMKYSCFVRFWIRQSKIGEEPDLELLKTLVKWFREDWQFTYVSYCTFEDDNHQVEMFRKADLKLHYQLETKSKSARVLLYGT